MATHRQFQATDVFQGFYRQVDVAYQMMVGVSVPEHPVTVAFALNRALADYTLAERTRLQLLGPHLQRAWLNALAYTELEARLGPREEALEVLTPREAEVLRWVAQGRTNAEIGAILGVTVSTVKRHLERAFVKLGVDSRAAAAVLVAAAQKAG